MAKHTVASGGRSGKTVAGHHAKKRFGQNFLVAHGIIDAIVAAVAPRADDIVVEIGPGLGALTEPLLARVDHLHVVEIDRDLIARLRGRHDPSRLSIHAGDALAFDFGALAQPPHRLRIVGNLPYNISSPLLFHLAQYANAVTDMHFMLQREVVDRMVAAPGTSDYGRLSVMLQVQFAMERLIDVPPESFDPAPKVDSAVVRMVPLAAPNYSHGDTAQSDAHITLFGSVVSLAFSQRRKMLRNTLRALCDEGSLRAAGIEPSARAEDLAVADYARLTDLLITRPSPANA